MKIKTKDLLLIFFIFLPLVIHLVSLNYLPNSVPMHYGFNGEVDRWGSKFEMLIVPILGIIGGMGCFIYTKCATKKLKNNLKAFNATTFVIALTFNILTIAFLITSFNKTTNINETISNKLIFSSIGFGFIILGNYMPKAKKNHYFGVRTKLTLSDDELWFKTQRFSGKLFVGFGLILTIISFFLPTSILLWFIMSSTLIITVLSCGYPRKLLNERKKLK